MAKYKLINDGQLVNIIEANQSFIDQIKDQYDLIEEIEEPEVVPPPPPEPEPAPPPPEPAPPPPEPAPITKVSPIEFKLLFTVQERVGISAAKPLDPIINDFFSIIDDPRLTFVDLTLTSTVSAINYLAEQGLIEPDRVAEILAAQFQ